MGGQTYSNFTAFTLNTAVVKNEKGRNLLFQGTASLPAAVFQKHIPSASVQHCGNNCMYSSGFSLL